MNAAVWTQPTRGQANRRWQALGAAFSLESVAIAAVVAWAVAHPAPPHLMPLAISIESAPTPTPAPPPPPVPAKATPTPVKIKSAPSLPTLPTPAPLPVVAAPSESAALPAPVTPVNAVAQAPTPPAPPPPAAIPSGPSAEYIAKVRAAVQAAFVYPAAARAAEFKGRTRVAFRLLDAKASGARVLVGSGLGLVDNAALQAVQKASYPAPPADQRNAELNFEVWVEFRL